MFEKEDIGKRVLLELDIEKSELFNKESEINIGQIAKGLGASAIFTKGTILEITENYVKIMTEPLGLTPLIAETGKKEKEVPYSLIKSYEFLQ
ncbi:MAG: hypothetical protein KKA65_02185 [Nanoarchaeota archaeon]|nr:hypothetical protein [Nanoarchaeota archaeon]MBU4242324.1 hypothetical protein [Nanoarchaeota archaeon]MBU4351489.1 hypothetical protein [Nanoarchaeota archaeon]MBU4456285.1 hypothetical protein [Nanoarchaeota archaeon]MCG2720135.1 hypothetical protein [Nanoarchaeota archaeon]